MELKEKLAKLEEIFDMDDGALSPDMQLADIEEWDSLTQVQLIVEIQKEFGVKFTSSDLIGWKNVGEMVDTIVGKVG